MTIPEWEALCDGCGKCCLEKVEDVDTKEIYTTAVTCRLLDCKSGKCTAYKDRFKMMDNCLKLTPKVVRTIKWLPKTCAYRLVKEGKDLTFWHPLITKNPNSTVNSNNSVKSFAIHPYNVNQPFYNYIIEESNE